MDYGNALLCNTSGKNINRLQKLQNSCARLITFTPRTEHITPTLQQLHWLPIDKRLQFKILVHTYRCLNGSAPSYMKDMLKPYTPDQRLRSSNQEYLEIPKSTTSSSTRSFNFAAPTLWNKLPLEMRKANTIKAFKKQLKTHLFSQ